MVKFRSRVTIDLPNLDFTPVMEKIAKKVIIPDMRLGINRSIGIDNRPFPKLEESTIKTKAKKKRPRGGTQQLVDTKVLRDESFASRKKKRNHVRIFLKGERSEIGKFLQIDGVGKSRKKFNFFGVSQRAELQSISVMNSHLKRVVAEVNRRGRS